jgi:uncharacterized protein (TIGR03000 family)
MRERETEREREREREKEKKKTGSGQTQLNSSASLIVDLPADATLTIEGQATTSTSARRVFVTPALPPGSFHYTLKAEVLRNGQKLTATEVVPVRAGATVQVSLPSSKFVSARVAAK